MADPCGRRHVYGHPEDRTWPRKSQLYRSSRVVQREQGSAPENKSAVLSVVLV